MIQSRIEESTKIVREESFEKQRRVIRKRALK